MTTEMIISSLFVLISYVILICVIIRLERKLRDSRHFEMAIDTLYKNRVSDHTDLRHKHAKLKAEHAKLQMQFKGLGLPEIKPGGVIILDEIENTNPDSMPDFDVYLKRMEKLIAAGGKVSFFSTPTTHDLTCLKDDCPDWHENSCTRVFEECNQCTVRVIRKIGDDRDKGVRGEVR